MKAAPRRSRKPLTLGTGALLMVGVGTLALIGLPDPGGGQAARGLIDGRLQDERGRAVANAPIGLFEGESNTLVEITHSDADGRFGFQQDPGRHHVYAGAPTDSGLVGVFVLDREAGQRALEVTLARGVPIETRVLDAEGDPLARAEVRAYAPGEAGRSAAIVASAHTDATGTARLLVPREAHLAALGPDHGHLPRWRFEHRSKPDEPALDFRLPDGIPVRGTVVDDQARPLADVLVSAWEDESASGDGWHWNGYQTTRAGGEFYFFGSAARTLLRACEREQTRLPVERRIEAPSRPVLVLQEAGLRTFACRDEAGRALPARVWAWSESANAWSWGARTDGSGSIAVAVDADHAIVAEPLFGGWEGAFAAYGLVGESTEAELVFTPGSPGSEETASQVGSELGSGPHAR